MRVYDFKIQAFFSIKEQKNFFHLQKRHIFVIISTLERKGAQNMKKILLLILLLLFSLTSCGTAIEDFIKNNTDLLPPDTDNNEQKDELR